MRFVDRIKALRAGAGAAGQMDQLSGLPTPVVAVDRDFTITYVNPAGAALLEKTPEQVRGMKCYNLLKTPHCQTPECRCQQAMTRDAVFTGETTAQPNGKNCVAITTWCAANAAPANTCAWAGRQTLRRRPNTNHRQ